MSRVGSFKLIQKSAASSHLNAFELILPIFLSQLSSVRPVRKTHLQIGSVVWTDACGEEDGNPACRGCGVQDQLLIEQVRKGGKMMSTHSVILQKAQ